LKALANKILANFMSVGFILWPFGICIVEFLWYIFVNPLVYFPVLVCCTKKNLATLVYTNSGSIFGQKMDRQLG
jgi:hypothetical protein